MVGWAVGPRGSKLRALGGEALFPGDREVGQTPKTPHPPSCETEAGLRPTVPCMHSIRAHWLAHPGQAVVGHAGTITSGGEQQQVPAVVVRFLHRPSRCTVAQRRWSTWGRGSCIKPVLILILCASKYLKKRLSQGRQSHDSGIRRVWHSRDRSFLAPSNIPRQRVSILCLFSVSNSLKRRHSSVAST